nr:MAG TPA: hypothetical protein [Bacteriophage sp.]
MERYIDDEAKKLIEELCQKEVKRTGIPLEYDERSTRISGDTLFFHQKIKFNIKDFDSVILKNQNDLEFKNGKWKSTYLDTKFYAYELSVERKNHRFAINLDRRYLPTEDEIIEMITSDRFKETFNEYNKEMNEIRKKMKSMEKIKDKTSLQLKKEK